MQNKKVSIIGSVGIPALYGGFETLVEHLSKHLNEKINLTVYCSSKSYDTKKAAHNGAILKYLPINANGVQSIPYDITSMLLAMRKADVILILGVSGCIALPIIKRLSKTKIIVNIDGLEWKRNKWNKHAKSFLKYSEKVAVKHADNVVTDNKAIQDYVRSEYSKDSTLIAYGGDHAEKRKVSTEMNEKYGFLSEKYAFSVCRIEPENNIHIILKAFSQQQRLPLVIIGNWNASQYGADLRKEFSSYEDIHLIDPIYDQQILDQFRSNCFIYVHGHSAGGTNPSLVEAMFLELPIFAYSVNYNIETTENRAYYFSNAEELSDLISNLNMAALVAVGEKMSEIASRRYRWNIIAEQYNNLF